MDDKNELRKTRTTITIVSLLAIFIAVAALVSLLPTSCTDERTVAGPTEYIHDTITTVDTITVVDTVIVNDPTSMHAYIVAQIFLEPEIRDYVETEFGVTIVGWQGHYSCFWNATTINQNSNTFILSGVVAPLLYIEGDDLLYYTYVEYTDLVATFEGEDPTNPNDWTIGWAASPSSTFKINTDLKSLSKPKYKTY